MADPPDREEDDEVIDGFTYSDIELMILDVTVDARCSECGAYVRVKSDAEGCDCPNCDATGSVTSPLRKLGLI